MDSSFADPPAGKTLMAGCRLQTADCRVGTGIFVAEKLAGEDA